MSFVCSASIDPRYYPTLTGCFRSPVFKDLFSTKNSRYLCASFNDSGVTDILGCHATVLEGLEFSYNSLYNNYRSDYIYRSALVNNIYLEKYSIENTTLLSEFAVHPCKADIVILNGTSFVYEIKTGLDSLNRLSKQIEAYQKMFDKIVVLTDKAHLKHLTKMVPDIVGICVLYPDSTIEEIRPAIGNASNVDPGTIFDSFRKEERNEATRMACGYVPDLPPLDLFDACKELFVKIPPAEAHSIMVTLLKKRNALKSSFLHDMPEFLKTAFLESSIKEKHWQRLFDTLKHVTLEDLTTT